ncbi:MAG: CHAT domain-containing protein [Saprospiraceae bacterium]|nr:CHAT domain-containing protein [Saprospiraceae bacterium]
MKTSPNIPVIFTAFANPKGDLSNLTNEQNDIQDALAPLDDAGRIKHLLRTDTDLTAYFDFLKRWENQLVLFHFAGHANSEAVSLQNADTFFKPLAEELIARQKDSLQLVFLNGCSTYAHVQTLFDLGVPAVIATSADVNDDMAAQFAVRFYINLAKGDSIEAAYASAANYVKSGSDDARFHYLGRVETWRGPAPRTEAVQEEIPWCLYLREGVDVAVGKVLLEFHLPELSFNQTFTRVLIESIRGYSISAQRFLERVESIPDWETQDRISDKAKEIIAYSFVGVIGVQISKLMAIGKEDYSDAKPRKYISKCIDLARLCLDLLCFTLLSKLWDEQKKEARIFDDTERRTLHAFFDNNFEASLPEKLHLLQTLHGIFAKPQNALDPPLFDWNNYAPALLPGSTFCAAIRELTALQERFERSKIKPLDYVEAEQQLASFFQSQPFWVHYRMASIRHIVFRQPRNDDPIFLHRYTALGIDNKANKDAEKINSSPSAVQTDAVLLYRGEYYAEPISLSPFLIDYNALTLEHGARICCYRAQAIDGDMLEYTFLDDNSVVRLEYQGIREHEPDLSKLLMQPENQKILNLDTMVAQFRDTRNCLLGETLNLDDL